MMGKQAAQDELFYEFRLEDHVPSTHLLRRIDTLIDFSFVRSRLAPSYSPIGRPSVDPELMMRMLLIGFLFGIRSERKLCDEVHLNLAYRWYCRLGLNGAVPDHSTFSKNRYGRFRENDLYRLMFEEVIGRCIAAGLVIGKDTAVDASMIEADASWEKKLAGDEAPSIFRDQPEVTRPVLEYLEALDKAVPAASDEREVKDPKYISETDPQAGWSTKHGQGRFGYSTNTMIDTETGCILDVEASPSRFAAEVSTTRVMVERVHERLDIKPERLAADKAYGSAPLLAWLLKRDIEPHIPVIERKTQTDGFLTRDAFRYDADSNTYICPQGQRLHYRGMSRATRVLMYRIKGKGCIGCPIKSTCTDTNARGVTRLVDEEARDRVRALAETEAYARSRKLRRRIERAFGHLKRNLKFRRLKLRGLAGATEEFLMVATAQNLQLLARRMLPA